jgi:AraC family transcriptional activator of pobA
LKTITTIEDYCKEINIAPPRYLFFDIRKFEDNMKTVNAKQPPFRHEFYAIALRISGENKEVHGQFLDSNLFFNSPYQVITWDIQLDWVGWYIMFSREFLSLNPAWRNFIIDFPFFRLDKAAPMNLPADDAQHANHIFEKIFNEYHSDNQDKFLFIQTYTHFLLLVTKRFFEKTSASSDGNPDNRATDILLASRFQTLVETMMTNEQATSDIRHPSFYADKLNIHPNHLNAVVKRITGKTATNIIRSQLIVSAKSLLRQTTDSVKEIAFRLYFSEPTHFNSFFKKATGLTPQQYRDNPIL